MICAQKVGPTSEGFEVMSLLLCFLTGVAAMGAGAGAQKKPPVVRWTAASCKEWPMTALCRTRHSFAAPPSATCDGGRLNQQRSGPVCARWQNSGPTACRDGSVRRPDLLQLRRLMGLDRPV